MFALKNQKVIVHIDGSSRGNPGHAALAVVITDGEHTILEKGDYLGITTNNVAEYSALLEALIELRRLGYKCAEIRSDSELLVKQIWGEYQVKADSLRPLYINAVRLLNEFDDVTVIHIPRQENMRADAIANRVLDEAEARSTGANVTNSVIEG